MVAKHVIVNIIYFLKSGTLIVVVLVAVVVVLTQ